MRHRLIDVALVVGLVLVAGAIVWTLFSLGRDPSPEPGPDAGPEIEAPATDGADGVVPVAPGGSPDGDGAGVTPAPPEDEAGGDGGDGDPAADGDEGAGPGGNGADAPDDAEAAAAEGGNDEAADPESAQEATGPRGDRPDPEVPAAEAPPLPESGPVDLGRVGFSYVTGGAGACGIVLEAWEHVAVSREMLEAYGCGAEIRITLDDEVAGRTSFDAVVADTMNPAFSRTVNVYVGEDEPAFEFGLTSGTLQPQ